jgi:hypothetical protein
VGEHRDEAERARDRARPEEGIERGTERLDDAGLREDRLASVRIEEETDGLGGEPSAPPIVRANIAAAVTTPRCSQPTLACTPIKIAVLARPMPRPNTNMARPSDQLGARSEISGASARNPSVVRKAPSQTGRR